MSLFDSLKTFMSLAIIYIITWNLYIWVSAFVFSASLLLLILPFFCFLPGLSLIFSRSKCLIQLYTSHTDKHEHTIKSFMINFYVTSFICWHCSRYLDSISISNPIFSLALFNYGSKQEHHRAQPNGYAKTTHRFENLGLLCCGNWRPKVKFRHCCLISLSLFLPDFRDLC